MSVGVNENVNASQSIWSSKTNPPAKLPRRAGGPTIGVVLNHSAYNRWRRRFVGWPSIELKDTRCNHHAMSQEGEGCIVAASYQGSGKETVVELWIRAREGHSVVLLIHGLRPFLEIAIPGKNSAIPSDIEQQLNLVRAMADVTEISGPVEKWTEFGMKPHCEKSKMT